MAAMATLSSFPSSSRFKEMNFGFYSSSELDSEVQGKGFVRFRRKGFASKKMTKRVFCKLEDGGDRPSNSSNDEPPESLFMKELRKRGISPTSVLEERNRSTIEEEIMEDGGESFSSKKNAVATDSDKSLTNQREESMALNSEGLE
ncbi:Methionine aminopeptidase, partial [Bienertia sinuspersici]